MAEPKGPTSFAIPLPNPAAALALAGDAESSTLRHLEALTGASLVLRGLDLVIQAPPSQLERAAALVELLRPLWQEGQAITQVDVRVALQALDTGRSAEHQQLGRQVLARSQSGKLLRPRTLRQQGTGALGAKQGVQGVVEGAQVGINFLLQIAR